MTKKWSSESLADENRKILSERGLNRENCLGVLNFFSETEGKF